MSKVRVKTRKANLKDKNVVSMFNQMLGTDDPNPEIVVPKYATIRQKTTAISKMLVGAVRDVISKSFPEQDEGCREIIEFATTLSDLEYLPIPSDTDTSIEDDDYDAQCREICQDYTTVKSSQTIRTIILTCKSLITYKKFLTFKGSDFDDSFIARIPGLSFYPFPFSSLNLKHMWISPSITPWIKKYILTVLKICLAHCITIYETITSPDVDVAEFSAAIIESMAQIKKQIPRCEKAFAKIEESVGLLEGNFGVYYKDFVQSQNPSTIIESFVMDVSQSGGGDAQTARQFRKIINHYRKMTAGKIKDPRIKGIFAMLNSNFDTMSTTTETEIKKSKSKKASPPDRKVDKK
jgi:hypothetical protein